MRIRSIKPEFWRDETIVALPVSTRLTFIGLWSYVDDNGVGDARVSSIVGDLYADDMAGDPQETLRRVSGDIQELERNRLIVTYPDPDHPARRLLYVRNWTKHQVINKPSKGNQYPLPTAETLDAPRLSGDTPETLGKIPDTPRAGTGEQGNGGAGERGNLAHLGTSPTDAPERETEARDEHPGPKVSPDAWRIVREHTPASLGQAVRTDLTLRAGQMLHAGTPQADVRACLDLWMTKPEAGTGLFPHLLAEVIKTRDYKPVIEGATTQKLSGWLDLNTELAHESLQQTNTRMEIEQ